MASAWGSSWGSAWGNAWGEIVTYAERVGGGKIRATGPSVNRFTRERFEEFDRELRAAHEAKDKVEQRAQRLKKKKARQEVQEAAEIASEVITQVEAAEFDPRLLEGLHSLVGALNLAAAAKSAAQAIREAQEAEVRAEALKALMFQIEAEALQAKDDEEAAIVLLMAA